MSDAMRTASPAQCVTHVCVEHAYTQTDAVTHEVVTNLGKQPHLVNACAHVWQTTHDRVTLPPMILLVDHTGVVHAARGDARQGSAWCGDPPAGTTLTDPAPGILHGPPDLAKCPACREILDPDPTPP